MVCVLLGGCRDLSSVLVVIVCSVAFTESFTMVHVSQRLVNELANVLIVYQWQLRVGVTVLASMESLVMVVLLGLLEHKVVQRFLMNHLLMTMEMLFVIGLVVVFLLCTMVDVFVLIRVGIGVVEGVVDGVLNELNRLHIMSIVVPVV